MIHWTSEKEFSTGGVNFKIDLSNNEERSKQMSSHFIIMKNRSRIEKYLQFARETNPLGNILELGCSEGGSTIFFDKIFEPTKIIGIDSSAKLNPSLEDYSLNNGSRLITYPNVAQTNKQRILKIVKEEFNNKIDLVIDDASHWYEPTKQSFKFLFPFLNPGAKYIIETWNWSFKPSQQNDKHSWFKKHSLANLLFEFIEDVAINNAIECVEINQEMAIIHKSNITNTHQVFVKNGRRGRVLEML